jgi:hypothetical protein
MLAKIGMTVIAVMLSGSAQAQYQSPYNPYPQQHYNNAPGLDAPGLTNIPGVRDAPPSYARPDYYNPVPTVPTYSPTYQPPSPYQAPSYGRPYGSPYGDD